ncbi:MAG: aminotransferase class I/II-fold pyridoxal phosphate-dependent enzyme [Clostridiales bacterium]|jgi:arginine/lysine/ornithine decarboxylase|nr:aminotransferase class I/II-fold pyridoxal phosphate-dependent enzyme [Clostridiales bacterium]
MKLQTPLSDAVSAYIKAKPLRFHTPGHQGVFDGPFFEGSKADITELSFSDNLLYPDGVIKQSERMAADFYKTAGTMYFTSGATSAIFTAVRSCAEYGRNLLVGKNAHKSVFNAAAIFGLNVVFYDAEDDGEGYVYPASANAIEAALSRLDDVAAVSITAPDYFGRCADVGKIYGAVKKYGTRLIVDEAHGAHFSFSGLLPDSAIGKADFVIDSCHKTMPVYSGGAILHCATDKLYADALFNRAVLHSTSPQYLTLISIELAVARLADGGEELYSRLYDKAEGFKREIAGSPYIAEEADAERGIERDFSRLVVNCGDYSAHELLRRLEERNIYAETALCSRAVFILSPYNPDALDGLAAALKSISLTEKADKTPFPSFLTNAPVYKAADAAGMSRGARENKGDADYGAAEYVDAENAAGRISATEIGVYPPGTPIVSRGGVITPEIIEYILRNRVRVFGLNRGKLAVLHIPKLGR